MKSVVHQNCDDGKGAELSLIEGARMAPMILEIRRGQAKRLIRGISQPVFTVGSGEDCDMVLGDQQFSPIHFYLLHRNGRTTIRPISSQPELTVNGKAPRSSTTVEPGDRIRTGPFEFFVKAA